MTSRAVDWGQIGAMFCGIGFHVAPSARLSGRSSQAGTVLGTIGATVPAGPVAVCGLRKDMPYWTAMKMRASWEILLHHGYWKQV